MSSFLRTWCFQKLFTNTKCPTWPLKRKDIIGKYLNVMPLVHFCRFVDKLVNNLMLTTRRAKWQDVIYLAVLTVCNASRRTSIRLDWEFVTIWLGPCTCIPSARCVWQTKKNKCDQVGLRIMNKPTLLFGCDTLPRLDRLISCWRPVDYHDASGSRSLLTTLHFEGYFMRSLLLVEATSWRFTRSAHRLTHALSVSHRSANYSAERGIENARRDFVGNTAIFQYILNFSILYVQLWDEWLAQIEWP